MRTKKRTLFYGEPKISKEAKTWTEADDKRKLCKLAFLS